MNLSLQDPRYKQVEFLFHETFLRNKSISELRNSTHNHWIGTKAYLNTCARFPNAVVLVQEQSDTDIKLNESIITFDSDEGVFNYLLPIKKIIANKEYILLCTDDTPSLTDLTHITLTGSLCLKGEDILKKSADIVHSMAKFNYPLYNEHVSNSHYNSGCVSCHTSLRLSEIFDSYTKSNNRVHFALHLVTAYY